MLVVVLAISVPTTGMAQDDPCEVCWAEHGAACTCQPVAPEPPTSSLACVPQTHAITGCADKVFLPQLGR